MGNTVALIAIIQDNDREISGSKVLRHKFNSLLARGRSHTRLSPKSLGTYWPVPRICRLKSTSSQISH